MSRAVSFRNFGPTAKYRGNIRSLLNRNPSRELKFLGWFKKIQMIFADYAKCDADSEQGSRSHLDSHVFTPSKSSDATKVGAYLLNASLFVR